MESNVYNMGRSSCSAYVEFINKSESIFSRNLLGCLFVAHDFVGFGMTVFLKWSNCVVADVACLCV